MNILGQIALRFGTRVAPELPRIVIEDQPTLKPHRVLSDKNDKTVCWYLINDKNRATCGVLLYKFCPLIYEQTLIFLNMQIRNYQPENCDQNNVRIDSE